MDELRRGIGLRAIGQKDPLIEYQFESYNLFTEMMDRVKDTFTGQIFRVRLLSESAKKERRMTMEKKEFQMSGGGSESVREPIKKAAKVLNRLTKTNALMPFYIEHKEKVLKALKNPDDRALLLIALVNTAYPFCYDVTATLGKYFHAQKTIGTPLLINKLSAKYGTNRTLPNGLYCIMPMLIDAGFVTRPKVGLYEMCRLSPLTEVARQAYTQSFMLNNPLFTDSYRAENNFYFEFIG